MTITYTLTADDVVESKRRRLRHKSALVPARPGKFNRRDSYLSWAFLILLIVGSGLVFVGGLHLGLNFAGIFLFLPLFIGLLWIFLTYMVAKSLGSAGVIETFNKDEHSGGPFTTEVRESGMSHVTPLWTAEIEWSAIHSVWETKNLLLVVDDTPRIIIVPKRAFATPDEMQQFIGQVTGPLRSAGN